MNEAVFFQDLLIGWLGLAAAIFITLLFVPAPYGRHSRSGWGPAISDRAGWVIMEAPAALAFAVFFAVGGNTRTVAALLLMGLWELHYVHRAFIYPFRLRESGRQMPLAVIGLGLLFNMVNAYLNGRYAFTFSGGYANQWLTDPRFIAGAALFIAGFVANRRADQVLRGLRKPGEQGYAVASSGLYRWVSCPNYLGEIAIWTGWAVATWSLAGLSFALWTVANLAPRARAHHAWYKQHFPDYPPDRKALLPGLW